MQNVRSGEILALTTDSEKNTVRFSFVWGVDGETVMTYYIGKVVGETANVSQRMASVNGQLIPADGIQIRFNETVYSAKLVNPDSMPPEFTPRYNLLLNL